MYQNPALGVFLVALLALCFNRNAPKRVGKHFIPVLGAAIVVGWLCYVDCRGHTKPTPRVGTTSEGEEASDSSSYSTAQFAGLAAGLALSVGGLALRTFQNYGNNTLLFDKLHARYDGNAHNARDTYTDTQKDSRFSKFLKKKDPHYKMRQERLDRSLTNWERRYVKGTDVGWFPDMGDKRPNNFITEEEFKEWNAPNKTIGNEELRKRVKYDTTYTDDLKRSRGKYKIDARVNIPGWLYNSRVAEHSVEPGKFGTRVFRALPGNKLIGKPESIFDDEMDQARYHEKQVKKLMSKNIDKNVAIAKGDPGFWHSNKTLNNYLQGLSFEERKRYKPTKLDFMAASDIGFNARIINQIETYNDVKGNQTYNDMRHSASRMYNNSLRGHRTKLGSHPIHRYLFSR